MIDIITENKTMIAHIILTLSLTENNIGSTLIIPFKDKNIARVIQYNNTKQMIQIACGKLYRAITSELFRYKARITTDV